MRRLDLQSGPLKVWVEIEYGPWKDKSREWFLLAIRAPHSSSGVMLPENEARLVWRALGQWLGEV